MVVGGPITIVDAHHHLWPSIADLPWLDTVEMTSIARPFTAGDLLPELAASNVSGTLLIEAGRTSGNETLELLAEADRIEEILGVVGRISLSVAELTDVVASFRGAPGGHWLSGLRDPHVAEPSYIEAAGTARITSAVQTLGRLGLVCDLVCGVTDLPAMAVLAAAAPDTSIVIDHLGKPRVRDGADGLSEWRTFIAPLAEFPNVTCKLSGLATEAAWGTWTARDLSPFIDTALELFGTDRLMFGSDWPVCLLAASYGQVLNAVSVALTQLSTDDRAAVLGRTALEVYRLELPAGPGLGTTRRTGPEASHD